MCIACFFYFLFSGANISNTFPPLFPLQGGSSWVPQEKERVRQMSGKPCGCVGKPKQDPDWRAESTEGHLLPQSWVVAAVCGHGLKTVPVTNSYNKIFKKETPETKTALTVFVSLLTQAGFFAQNSEVSQWNLNSSSLPVSLLFLSCGRCMWRLKCRTHCACCCFCALA